MKTSSLLVAALIAASSPRRSIAASGASAVPVANNVVPTAIRRRRRRHRVVPAEAAALSARGRRAGSLPLAAPFGTTSHDSLAPRGGGDPDDDATASSASPPLAVLALSGAVAAVVGDAVLHPIDCIKTLQQSGEGAGLSMAGAAGKIFERYGAGGFFRGMWTYATSDSLGCALKMMAYESLKTGAQKYVPSDFMGPALFLCAALSFIAMSIIAVPGELLKSLLQTGKVSSVPSGISSIVKEEGVFGLYRGYSGVCLRDVPYTMFELGLYDNLKRIYLDFKKRGSEGDDDLKSSQLDDIVIGAVTGAITGFVTTPFDSIKTKLMVDAGMYSGFLDCLSKTVREHGIGSIFQGAAARVFWIMPFTAIYLPLYEFLKVKLTP